MITFKGAWLGKKNVCFGTTEAIDQFYADAANT